MSGIVNVILNVVLIPKFGIVAAALNTFLCVAAAHYGIFLLKDLRALNPINFAVVAWLSVTVIVFVLTWLIKDLQVIHKLGGSLFAVAVVCCYFFRLSRAI